MANRSLLWHLIALFVSISEARAVPRPNVILLVTDDQRADTIAALGNPLIKTPNLDNLARRGFAFHNAYCMGSTMGAVCNPSRHMLLSGRSLYRYRPQHAEGTFADVMNKAGYVTWHFGKRGNTARAYHKAFLYSGYLDDTKERISGHHGRAAADRAIDFLKEGWDREQPLFMYVAFEGPHDPRVADDKGMSLYRRDDIPLPPNYSPFHPFNNGELLIRDERLAPWPRSPEVVRSHLHDYYACISSLDYQIGRILGAFEDIGQLDNTIVVFTSDHGLAIGSHGLFGKQNLYEHSMKSPLIFAGPGIPHGSSQALVYLFDIFPTVANLVHASLPADIDGKSLRPVIEGQADHVRDSIILAYGDVQRAVRKGYWKLIRYPQVGVTQLFHLGKDPAEVKNLAGDAQTSQRVAELMELLSSQQQYYGDTATLTADEFQPAAVDQMFFERNMVSPKR